LSRAACEQHRKVDAAPQIVGRRMGFDLDKGLENPSRDQAKEDERAQAEQL
jgi:hypothetical protein